MHYWQESKEELPGLSPQEVLRSGHDEGRWVENAYCLWAQRFMSSFVFYICIGLCQPVIFSFLWLNCLKSFVFILNILFCFQDRNKGWLDHPILTNVQTNCYTTTSLFMRRLAQMWEGCWMQISLRLTLMWPWSGFLFKEYIHWLKHTHSFVFILLESVRHPYNLHCWTFGMKPCVSHK